MDKSQRRELSKDLNRSSGGFELAFVAAIFGGLGLLLDHWFGTTPFIGLVCFLSMTVACVFKLWLGYDQQMKRLEAEGPWARRS